MDQTNTSQRSTVDAVVSRFLRHSSTVVHARLARDGRVQESNPALARFVGVENLSWSLRFARGQKLAFSSDQYRRYFDWVCEEVASRSPDPAQLEVLEECRLRGQALIHELVDPRTA